MKIYKQIFLILLVLYIYCIVINSYNLPLIWDYDILYHIYILWIYYKIKSHRFKTSLLILNNMKNLRKIQIYNRFYYNLLNLIYSKILRNN